MILQVIRHTSIGEFIRVMPPRRSSKRSWKWRQRKYPLHRGFKEGSSWWACSATLSGGPRRTKQIACRTRLRSQVMLDISRMVVGFSSDQEMENSGTERATTNQRGNDMTSHTRCESTPIERTPSIPLFLSAWKESAQMQTWKNHSLQCRCKQSWIAYVNDFCSASINNLPRCINLERLRAEDAARYTWFSSWFVSQRCFDNRTTCSPWPGWSNARAWCDPPSSRFLRYRKSFKRSWFSLDSLSRTNIRDATVNVIETFRYHDDLLGVREYKGCKRTPTTSDCSWQHRHWPSAWCTSNSTIRKVV